MREALQERAQCEQGPRAIEVHRVQGEVRRGKGSMKKQGCGHNRPVVPC